MCIHEAQMQEESSGPPLDIIIKKVSACFCQDVGGGGRGVD